MLTIRASELGSCLKAQIALHLGHKALPTPDRMQAAYDRGNEHEEANAAALRDKGCTVQREQEEVVLQITDDVQIVGHIDGVVLAAYYLTLPDSERDQFLWESKSPAAWAKFRDAHLKSDWSDPLAHRYAWQISTYMIATGLEAMVTCLDGDEVKSFVIEVPPFDMVLIEARAKSIDWWVREGKFPDDCTQNDYPCPVAYLHTDEEEIVADREMDALVADYHSAGEMVKEWKAKQDKVKARIEEHLGERPEVTTALSKVTRYEQKAAVKYDMDMLRAFLANINADLEEFVLPGKPSTRIKITQRGAPDDV